MGYALGEYRSGYGTEWPFWLTAMCLAGVTAAVLRLSVGPPNAKTGFTLGFFLRLGADLGSLLFLLSQPVTRQPEVMPPVPIIVVELAIVAAIHGAIAAGVAKAVAPGLKWVAALVRSNLS